MSNPPTLLHVEGVNAVAVERITHGGPNDRQVGSPCCWPWGGFEGGGGEARAMPWAAMATRTSLKENDDDSTHVKRGVECH